MAVRIPARREIRDLPGPRGLPLLGSLHSFRLHDVHLVVERWCERYGSLYTFRAGRRRYVVVSDREAAAREGQPIEIQRELTSCTVDIATALAFGVDVNTLERGEDELQRNIQFAFEMLGRRVLLPIPYWRWIQLPADRRMKRALAALEVAVRDFIDQARRQLDRHPERREEPTNFLEAMLAAQSSDGSFDDEEIFGNTMTLLFAGEDTTAHSMAWALWYLAREPEVQERWAQRGGGGARRGAGATRPRGGRAAPLRRRGAARVDAAQGSGSRPNARTTCRRRDRRRTHPRPDAHRDPYPSHRPRGRRDRVRPRSVAGWGPGPRPTLVPRLRRRAPVLPRAQPGDARGAARWR